MMHHVYSMAVLMIIPRNQARRRDGNLNVLRRRPGPNIMVIRRALRADIRQGPIIPRAFRYWRASWPSSESPRS
jgi:hypothetical protein